MSHLHAGAVSRPARPYDDAEDLPLLEADRCLVWTNALAWLLLAGVATSVVAQTLRRVARSRCL